MRRDALLQLIDLKEELISTGRPNRQGVIIKPTFITIHNTSNRAAGADANAHSKFVRNTGYYTIRNEQGVEEKNWVSWHFTVDDKTAIRHLPDNEKALHAGAIANKSSIAIEVCMQSGIDQSAANEKAAQLAAVLCYDLGIPPSAVVPHKKWTGKNCPELLLAIWDEFLEKIGKHLYDLKKEVTGERASAGVNIGATSITSKASLCWTEALADRHDLSFNSMLVNPVFAVQQGFNTSFLAAGEVLLPLHELTDPERAKHRFVHHQNLTTYFNSERKLALYSACNYDKQSLFEEINRSNSFRIDSLVNTEHQLGEGFYRSKTLDITEDVNCFDRGHIIARRYNQWGATEEEARQGERDTYFFTGILPQVKELNQDEWENLESFIIERGALQVKRVSVIAGALLPDHDPVATYIDKFEGIPKTIQIPQVFWKVVFYEVDGEMRKIAFLMSQRNRLRELEFVKFTGSRAQAADPFDQIGDPLKTYIINSSLIELHSGLHFSAAKEKYDKTEPLEAVIDDNETHAAAFPAAAISQYI